MHGLSSHSLRAALAFLAVLPATSPARTWYVTEDGLGDAPTIQAAIDSAATGDTIRVGPGTYDDFVYLYKGGVRLLSEEGAESTILARALDVYPTTQEPIEISGFTATGRQSPDGWPGIYVYGGVVHLHHCVSRGNYGNFTTGGIIARAEDPGDEITIEHTQVYDNGWSSASVWVAGNVLFARNTVRGDDTHSMRVLPSSFGAPEITLNILANGHPDGGPFDCGSTFEGAVVTCNLFGPPMNPDRDCMAGPENGFFADPYFCGPMARNYSLRADSPALAKHHPDGYEACDDIGALGIGCPGDEDGIHVVDPSGAGDFESIGAAVDYALPGDTILLRDGTFTGPGNRNLVVDEPVTIRSESGDPSRCIVDCEGTPSEDRWGFSFRAPIVFEGITVRNALVKSLTGGGAIRVGGNSADGTVIRRARFEDNESWLGAAIYAVRNGSGERPHVTIDDCVFESNEGDIASGGIDFFQFDAVVTGCRFTGNSAGRAAAIDSETSSVLIEDSVFADNAAGDYGGAIAVSRGDLTARRCVFRRNDAALGGALHGAGDAVITFENVTLAANAAASASACALADASLRFDRGIAWDGCAGDRSEFQVRGGAALEIVCSDLDPKGIVFDPLSTVSVDETSFTADPRFCVAAVCSGVTPAPPDLGLRADSPCLAEASPCGALVGARGACIAISDGRRPRAGIAWPSPFRASVRIAGTTPRAAVRVFDAQGRLVRVVIAGADGVARWDGTVTSGSVVGAGVYFARDTGSARTWRLIRAGH